MKVSTLRGLEKYFEESASFSPLYLIASPHAIDRREIAVRVAFSLESQHPGGSLKNFVGSAGFPRALDELRTNDLFATVRMIFLDEVDVLKLEEIDSLKRYLSQPSAKIFCILGIGSARGLSSFLPLVKTEGVLLDLLQEKPWDRQSRLIEDLQRQASRANIIIAAQVFDFLLQHIGMDWTLLKCEMEKLLCYGAAKGQVSFEEARCLLAGESHVEGWALAEQIVYQPLAFLASASLDAAGFLALLGQMRYFLRMGRQIALGEEKALKPYQVQKFKERVREKGLSFFERGLIALNEAESLAKSSTVPSDLLFTRFITNLHMVAR